MLVLVLSATVQVSICVYMLIIVQCLCNKCELELLNAFASLSVQFVQNKIDKSKLIVSLVTYIETSKLNEFLTMKKYNLDKFYATDSKLLSFTNYCLDRLILSLSYLYQISFAH